MATSQTTRAAIVSVLPAPAPATTSAERAGAAITSACSPCGRGQAERGGEGLGRQHAPVLPQGPDSSGIATYEREVGAYTRSQSTCRENAAGVVSSGAGIQSFLGPWSNCMARCMGLSGMMLRSVTRNRSTPST